ncbi:unnamed protein product [Adineta steineri]|uniref:Uncharacterized protein n=1 Tax=Adineta steineri TaxID=433720 RepID=A0A814YYX8_9BILA|nr:unnamed protein product [Adineta steineri]
MYNQIKQECTLFSEHVEYGSGTLYDENLITIRLNKDSINDLHKIIKTKKNPSVIASSRYQKYDKNIFDETCGTDLGFCHDDSTLPPAAIAIIIMASICCFITCLSCCIHSHQRQQRLQANFANANTRMNTNPYQQQVIHGPVRVVHVRPVSYVGAVPTSRSFPSIYEAPPPSYEIATASLPSIHGSSSSYPPMIATVEQSHSSIV